MSSRPLNPSALIPDPSRQRMYRENLSFKMSIDLLAQMIPRMIDGLALSAHEDEERRRLMERAMLLTPAPPFKYDPILTKIVNGKNGKEIK